MTIEDFINYILSEKRYSRHTAKAYESDLMQFRTFLSQTSDLFDLKQVTEKTIRSWVVSLKEKQLDNSSINRKLSSIRAYYDFLIKNEVIVTHPVTFQKALKTKKRVATFVPQSDMINYGQEVVGEQYDSLVKRVIIESFYQSGMRLSELMELKLNAVDFSNSVIKVHGKRNKQRLIPFHNGFNQLLTHYLKQRAQMNPENDYVIINQKGKRPSSSWIYKVVSSELKKVTTLTKTSPHVLRHTFATHLLNNGASLIAVKELLGHTSLAATQVYTHNTIDQLKKIHQQAHPKG